MPSRYKSVELRPPQGGKLIGGLAEDTGAEPNYSIKKNFRRDLDVEMRREGWSLFNPKFDKNPLNMPLYEDDDVTLFFQFSRPNGDTALLAAAGDKLYRLFAEENLTDFIDREWVEPDANKNDGYHRGGEFSFSWKVIKDDITVPGSIRSIDLLSEGEYFTEGSLPVVSIDGLGEATANIVPPDIEPPQGVDAPIISGIYTGKRRRNYQLDVKGTSYTLYRGAGEYKYPLIENGTISTEPVGFDYGMSIAFTQTSYPESERFTWVAKPRRVGEIIVTDRGKNYTRPPEVTVTDAADNGSGVLAKVNLHEMRRWEAVALNGYAVCNNGIDLPYLYREEWEQATQVFALRELGIVRVGCIAEHGGYLVCSDLTEFAEGELDRWVSICKDNGIDPYSNVTPELIDEHNLKVDETQYAVMWSAPGDPTEWGSSVVGSIQADTNRWYPKYPNLVKSFNVGEQFIVSGVGPSGANLVTEIEEIASSGGEVMYFTLKDNASPPATTDAPRSPTGLDADDHFDPIAPDDLDADWDIQPPTGLSVDPEEQYIVDTDFEWPTEANGTHPTFYDYPEGSRPLIRAIGNNPLANGDLEDGEIYEVQRYNTDVLGGNRPDVGDARIHTLDGTNLGFNDRQDDWWEVVKLETVTFTEVAGNAYISVTQVEGTPTSFVSATGDSTGNAQPPSDFMHSDVLSFSNTVGGSSVEILGDGSRILKMEKLMDVLIIYRQTGYWMAQLTQSADDPFSFTERYTGNRAALFRHSVANIVDKYHIFVGLQGVFKVDLTEAEPSWVNSFQVGPQFWRDLSLYDQETVFAYDNALTGEIWMCLPKELGEDSTLAYDYRTNTLSHIDQHFTAGLTIRRPQNPFTERSDDMVIISYNGIVYTYGYGYGDIPPVFNRVGEEYTSVISSTLMNFRDRFNEKDIRSYVLLLDQTNPAIGTRMELYTQGSLLDEKVLVVDHSIDDLDDETMVPVWSRALFYKDKITVTGKDNPLRLASRIFEVSDVKSRSQTQATGEGYGGGGGGGGSSSGSSSGGGFSGSGGGGGAAVSAGTGGGNASNY